MKLSKQAVGTLLMTLQKCLIEETDITVLLEDWDLEVRDDEVWVTNPPEFVAESQQAFEESQASDNA